MASILSKIRSALASVFPGRPKPPVPPRLGRVEGHRGIAAGSLKERTRKQERGEYPYSQEEIDKWQTVGGNEVYDFVQNQEILFVNSSNLVAAQYFANEKKLMIEYKGGSAYVYNNITEQEAVEFAQAQSKGGWIWSNIRVRGSKTAHQKPFSKLRG